MTARSIEHVMGGIRKVCFNIGTFERSFPKILKGSREFTRAHLVILHECLPDLKKVLRYAAASVPVAARMTGLASEGVANLSQASEMLSGIRKSTENAVNDIFTVMERIDPLLELVAEAEGIDKESKQALSEAMEQLNGILGALQFQDITSQQIEATNALLAQMSSSLGALLNEDETFSIDVNVGTYDKNARYDSQISDPSGTGDEVSAASNGASAAVDAPVSQAEVDLLIAGE